MRPEPEAFAARARRALEDGFLRQAIAAANRSFQAARSQATAALPDWERLREEGQAIRRRALEYLPQALEAFEGRWRERGGEVHWAEDGAAACRIVLEIARRRGVRRAVKSKSMVTEEVGLNDELGRAGIEVTETDLGEFIVQLAGETPSHIITPAIHKSRREIAKLLHEKIGSPADADIPEMTRAARATLRERFLRAEMGITGANFAVAETGTLVIVENEGNARLVTTLPPVHVALVGIEKVVPRLEDTAVLLRLLTRSATGQKVTSYVSFIGSRRLCGEPDGPEECHVVFVDNGRSRMWADVEARAALSCIRCGACLNYCPVYERVGGHAYGSVYPGPIGAVITPWHAGIERAAVLPQASSLCGRCGEVCPVKIPLPAMLLDLRARGVEAGQGGLAERFAMALFAALARSPRLWRLALAAGRPLARRLARSRVARRLPGPVGAWMHGRELPPVGGPSFRRRWRELSRGGGGS